VSLVACPFCREMFEKREATECPVCGMRLASFDKLPPSQESEEEHVPTAPELEPFGALYLGRGRGALAASGLLGLLLFFAPWIEVALPDTYVLSGFDLGRRLGWSWGAGVAWLVLVPTVLSRRTIAHLRGARVAAAFLSAVPAITVAVLLARPPQGRIVPLQFTYGWGLHTTLALSIVAVLLAVRLGGRVDDIRVARGGARGETVH
jgi:hypothetical protein